MRVDHYMVDYSDAADRVQFANAEPLASMGAARALARRTSCKAGAAYVVAFADDPALPGRFMAIGHVPYYDGRASAANGRLFVGSNCPVFGARLVRPSDCGASTYGRWAAVPYSAMASILAAACRHDPVMPIYPVTPDAPVTLPRRFARLARCPAICRRCHSGRCLSG